MPLAPLSRRRKVHCSSSSGLGIGGALAAPVGAGRFVIRATHERGVGVPSSRSLATASREATSFHEGRPGHEHIFISGGLAAVSRTRAAPSSGLPATARSAPRGPTASATASSWNDLARTHSGLPRGAVGWSSATESRAQGGQGWSYVPSHSHGPRGGGSHGNSTCAASTPRPPTPVYRSGTDGVSGHVIPQV
jgi:hypothetical protein